MEFKDLLDQCKAEAILNKLQASEVSVWRTLCRSYSEKFATPLHLCLNGTIPPEDILLAVFESQLEDYDEDNLDALVEQIYLLEDNDYEREKADDLEEFIEKSKKEESERIKLGKPIHKALKGEPTLKEVEPEKPKRTSGSINLEYLAKEEGENGNF